MKLFGSLVLALAIVAVFVLGGLFLYTCSDSSIMLNGTGASFPNPVYSVWTHNFSNTPTSKILVNYQSIGSGAGVKQVSDGTVDFGGSDEPLKIDELRSKNLFQVPMVAGAVAIGFNIPGIKNLNLDADTLTRIFLGKITNWNDPAIKALNTGLQFRDIPIHVVHRADGSGTTWLFTSYLSAVSTQWKEQIGAAKVVSWPIGVAGKGNEGVATYIQQLEGSIGYIEEAYATANGISVTNLKNADGNFTRPSLDSVKAAIQNVKWDPTEGFYQTFINLPGPNAWPIIGVSYILFPRNLVETKKNALHTYLNWCYAEGGPQAEPLGYAVIALPDLNLNQLGQ